MNTKGALRKILSNLHVDTILKPNLDSNTHPHPQPTCIPPIAMTFLKNDPRPCATLKQVFLDRFEVVVAHFGPPKFPKCLENGLLWDKKWVKNGSTTHFPNLILDHLGCING